MKKLLFIMILASLTAVSIATDRTGTIRPGYTQLSTPMVFTVADAINQSETVNITITNIQKYMQYQTFTVTLDNISGTTDVVCTGYGKVNSGDTYVAIGDAATLSADGTATITAATPNNYNYLKLALVAGAGAQHSHITAFEVKTANAYDIPVNSGTLTVSRATTGTVTVQVADDNANAAAVYRAGGTGALTLGASTGSTTITSSGTVALTNSNVEIGVTSANETTPSLIIQGDADSDGAGDTDEALTIDLTANATPTLATWGFTSTQSAGYTFDKKVVFNGGINLVGPVNSAITGGTVVTSAGLLGGAGTATNASQTLGAAGGKAFSYYLSSTSTTASHVLTGYYMNVNYGVTGGASAGPSGDAIRGRAYLMGDASGGSAVTGGAFTVELEATTASNTGLTAGLRGNLVLPSGVLTNSGTFYGTMAEVFLGGAAVDTRAYTEIAPLGIVVGGTAATSAAQLSNMGAMAIRVPDNMITADGTMVVTGSIAAAGAGLKIYINGTPYWIMLSATDE